MAIKRRILETEGGRIRSHCGEVRLRKSLWAFCKVDYRINELINIYEDVKFAVLWPVRSATLCKLVVIYKFKVNVIYF